MKKRIISLITTIAMIMSLVMIPITSFGIVSEGGNYQWINGDGMAYNSGVLIIEATYNGSNNNPYMNLIRYDSADGGNKFVYSGMGLGNAQITCWPDYGCAQNHSGPNDLVIFSDGAKSRGEIKIALDLGVEHRCVIWYDGEIVADFNQTCLGTGYFSQFSLSQMNALSSSYKSDSASYWADVDNGESSGGDNGEGDGDEDDGDVPDMELAGSEYQWLEGEGNRYNNGIIILEGKRLKPITFWFYLRRFDKKSSTNSVMYNNLGIYEGGIICDGGNHGGGGNKVYYDGSELSKDSAITTIAFDLSGNHAFEVFIDGKSVYSGVAECCAPGGYFDSYNSYYYTDKVAFIQDPADYDRGDLVAALIPKAETSSQFSVKDTNIIIPYGQTVADIKAKFDFGNASLTFKNNSEVLSDDYVIIGGEILDSKSVLGGAKNTYTFVVMDDRERVDADLASVTAKSISDTDSPIKDTVISNLNIPQMGENGSAFVWTSSDESVIAPDGTVTRPTDKNIVVTLTCTATCGTVTDSKKIKITVLGNHIYENRDSLDNIAADIEEFGDDDILNEAPKNGNIIMYDVNLPKELANGTKVSWESSHPGVINSDTGKVTRPVDVDENPYVTLTATFSNGNISVSKDFSYYVLMSYTNMDKQYEIELSDITYDSLSKENPAAVKASLNLLEIGLYDSIINWSSSNPNVITNSGRVIRPRYDAGNADVTMTASIGNVTKEFNFTVIADSEPRDPMYISDEEFFGVWNGDSFESEPQLDYSVPGLTKVCEMAKLGNYEGAREELYNYFLTRNVPSPLGLGSRRTSWVESRIDGLYSLLEEGAYYRATAKVTSDDYELVTADIDIGTYSVSKGKFTFEILASHNESNTAYIMGRDAKDYRMVPTIDVTVNGAVRTYEAIDTATIRAGKYSGVHIDDKEVLIAKMYGDFLGDETYRTLLQFDLSDLKATDVIQGIKLNFYAKKSSPSAYSKQLFIVDNSGETWSDSNVYWDSLNFISHNYNGLEGGYDWKGAKHTDVEFSYQAPRMTHIRSVLTEYKYTGNERYAYAAIMEIMDFIKDSENITPYPRSIDAGIRLQQLVPVMNALSTSKYFTPDFVTAFMKYTYQQYKYFPSRGNATGNWRDYEQLAVLYSTSAYPELSNSVSTREACIESWNNAFAVSFFPDGSYIEDTGGYNRSAFSMYRDFRRIASAANITLPASFDERLHNATYFMNLMVGPGGLSLGYGDEGHNTFSSGVYSDLADIYNDYELKYIDTFGREGVEPTWTSYHFPDTTYTTMRSDWKKDAAYLFTNVRGNSATYGHGHADDNGIIFMANGKRLLVDAGRFSYNHSSDPARIYGVRSQAHNTVVINDQSQLFNDNSDTDKGSVHVWTTNSDFDFLSQTAITNAHHDHTRNILFIKDGFFIVSDLMTPDDIATTSTYEQYWHMTPEAGITADTDKNQLRSNFDDGKNIILASADEVDTIFKDGYFENEGGSYADIKAGIFKKSVQGLATFDTVAYASKYTDAKVDVERIDIGKATSDATAIKFKVYENSKETTYYYMYNHGYTEGEVVKFGNFFTDARVALIGVDSDNNITDILYADGTYIEYNGNKILATDDSVTDISVKASKTRMDIVSSDGSLKSEDIEVKSGSNIKTVTLNGEAKEFTNTGGNVTVGSGNAEDVLVDDDNKHSGVGSAGGSQGGSQGGTGSVPGGNVTPPAVESTFTDIDAHWGKAEIEFLADKGIVNGNPDGTFKPDNTITRAEFIAIAMRAVGADKLDYQGTFSDVTSADWFAKDVQTAISIGVISEDINFRPNDNITREEMSKILTLCSKYMAKKDNETKELSFTDTSSISPWAVEYVQYAFSGGLMNGRSDGTFDPQGDATRAESAAVFARLIR